MYKVLCTCDACGTTKEGDAYATPEGWFTCYASHRPGESFHMCSAKCAGATLRSLAHEVDPVKPTAEQERMRDELSGKYPHPRAG